MPAANMLQIQLPQWLVDRFAVFGNFCTFYMLKGEAATVLVAKRCASCKETFVHE